MVVNSMENLIASGKVPPLHKVQLSETISISEFRKLQKLSPERVSDLREAVVMDDSIWAGSAHDLASIPLEGTVVYSSDGERVAMFIRRQNYGVYRIGEAGLHPETYDHLYTKNTNNNNVEELKSMGMDKLQQLQKLAMGDGEGAPPADLNNGTKPMDSFNGDGAPTPGSEEDNVPAGLRAAITSQAENVELADAYALQKNNQKKGNLTAFVTDKDKKIDFTLTSVLRTDDNNKPILNSTADATIKAQHNAGETVARTYYQQEFKIVSKESRPSKILAAVIAIPVSGFVKFEAFRSAAPIEFDEKDTDLGYHLIGADMYPTIVEFYFGGVIKENPATHGASAANLVLKRSAKEDTKGTETLGTSIINRYLKAEKRSSLLKDGNFFPIKTYVTVNANGPMDPETVKLLNDSAFRGVVRSMVTKTSSERKIDQLVQQDQGKITFADDVITSKFFTTNAAEAEPLLILPFYDKKLEPIKNIEIPVKRFSKSETSQTGSWKYDIVNTLEPKLAENPERRAWASLYSGKFAQIIEASQGAISEETLFELVRRSSNRKGRDKKKKEISNDLSMRMQLGLATNTIGSNALRFTDGGNMDYARIQNAITDLRVQ